MPRPFFTLLILIVFAPPALAKELWERKWIEVRSPHFVIVSAISEERTVRLSRDLEGFRTAVQIITSIGRVEERIPTTVYVLPHAVAELGFKKDLAGYFMPLMRANYAVVRATSKGHFDNRLKHEYVHFLLHNRDALSYPRWFEEGFAEVLETLTIRRDLIEYGRPSGSRLNWLVWGKWIPFEMLLDTHDALGLSGQSRPMFYAQSWLLMHYLMNERPGRKFDADTQRYLGLVEAGAKPMEAFEEAFGLPVSQLRDTLSRYVRGTIGYYRGAPVDGLREVPTEVRIVSADRIAAEFGLLASIFEETARAKDYWDAAIALNPNNTMALVGLGDLHKAAGRFDAAQPFYEKAIALEPLNAYPELDYAEYFLDRARFAKDPAEVANDLTEARRHFARSYKLDPGIPETLAMNGSSYLLAGESVDKALQSLTAAHEMLPSQTKIKLLLAVAHMQAGARADATRLLRSLVAWSGDGTGEEAKKLLQQMETEVGTGEWAAEAAAAAGTADE